MGHATTDHTHLHDRGLDRLLDDLAAMRVEEDGEDTFTPTPAKCLRFGCGGDVLPAGGYHRCMRCGGSYGAVSAQQGPDLAGLRMVVEAVRDAPEEQFDMTSWQCGTTACAIGWFCAEHPDDELKLVPRISGSGKMPEFKGSFCFDAVSRRFRLSDVVTSFMFMERQDHERPADVIARLEQFIREHEQPAAVDRAAQDDAGDRMAGERFDGLS